MTAACYLASGLDRHQPAATKSVPWLSLVLWAAACVLFLAGANADAAEYSGRNGAKLLLHHACLSVGAMVTLYLMAVLALIALNESADMALKYGMFAPALILGLLTVFRRDRRP